MIRSSTMKHLTNIMRFTLLLLPVVIHALPEPLIRNIMVTKNRVTVHAHKNLENAYLRESYFAQYGPDIDLTTLDYTIVTIPFIMNIAPIVWYSGETYLVPAMDEDLFYALEKIRHTLRTFFPSNSWSGAIVAQKLVKNRVIPHKTTSLVTLFSGGLDATYSVLNRYPQQQLLVTVQGGDIQLHESAMWRNVTQQNKEFARQHGHAYSTVASNFGCFLNTRKTRFLLPHKTNWWAETTQALTYCGLVAPLAYVYGCDTIVLAATHTASHPYPLGTHPAIDNSIRCANIAVHHDGTDKTRTEKIIAMRKICEEYNLACPQLRVCWGEDPTGGNCLSCEKCVRTIMELFIAGEDPERYGFKISLKQAIEKARMLLENPIYKRASVWRHWLCMRNIYQEQMATKKIDNFDPALLSWCQWLCEQPLESCVHNYEGTYTDAQTEMFTQLWKKAVDGTV